MSPSHHLDDDPTFWEVTLDDGQRVSIRATAYGREGSDYTFVLLFKGTPYYEMEIARFPKTSVRNIFGGWIEDLRENAELRNG